MLERREELPVTRWQERNGQLLSRVSSYTYDGGSRDSPPRPSCHRAGACCGGEASICAALPFYAEIVLCAVSPGGERLAPGSRLGAESRAKTWQWTRQAWS